MDAPAKDEAPPAAFDGWWKLINLSWPQGLLTSLRRAEEFSMARNKRADALIATAKKGGQKSRLCLQGMHDILVFGAQSLSHPQRKEMVGLLMRFGEGHDIRSQMAVLFPKEYASVLADWHEDGKS